MVARMWRGRTRRADAAEYLEYVRETGVARQRGTDGNLASLVFTRPRGPETEFVVLSLWDSMDSVRRFAGPEPGRAVYYPEDRRWLKRLDPGVEHYAIPVAQLEEGRGGVRGLQRLLERAAWSDGPWAPPGPEGDPS